MSVRNAVDVAIESIEGFVGNERSEILDYLRKAKKNRETLAIAVQYIEEAVGDDKSETLDYLKQELGK